MGSIKIYNTLTRKIEDFKPIKEGEVSMYNCGPTVYDTPHIGNYRTLIMADIVRRVLEYNDLKVKQVMNITDVDDKTINRSHREKIPLGELTKKYEELFMSESISLNILRPHNVMRATENIDEMIRLIDTLLEKGIAYKAEDGVYLSISKVKNYGELAHLKPSDTHRERITNDEYDKENPSDFALWKFSTPGDKDVSWDASFGSGRPGWHIECSAMSMKALGSTIDIHTGASDLIFPHHTNEIAQSESATGKPFVHYWMHGGFMTANDEKMAKSKNNFVKMSDLEQEFVSPLAYRYWLLTAHYRTPLNFTLEAVKGAQNALIRLMATISEYSEGGHIIESYTERFRAFINDDLDMPKAIALVWELIKDTAQKEADKRATLLDFDRVFGLRLDAIPRATNEPIPEEITALADAREEARREKDWEKADALRLEIESRGYTLKDTPEGIVIKRI